jgi:hypothetical protein
LVQNRSFEDNASLIAWTPLVNSNTVATFELDQSSPLNPNNLTSLKIHIEKTGGERVGVFNQGFKGILATGKASETSEQWIRHLLKKSVSQLKNRCLHQALHSSVSLRNCTGYGLPPRFMTTPSKMPWCP